MKHKLISYHSYCCKAVRRYAQRNRNVGVLSTTWALDKTLPVVVVVIKMFFFSFLCYLYDIWLHVLYQLDGNQGLVKGRLGLRFLQSCEYPRTPRLKNPFRADDTASCSRICVPLSKCLETMVTHLRVLQPVAHRWI